jgi:signal transduction histidine kinase
VTGPGTAWIRRARTAAAGWQEHNPLLADGLLAALVVLAAVEPTVATVGPEIGDLPVRPADALALALVLLQAAPLLVRRRWPAACLAVAGAGFVARELLAYPTSFAGVALYVALYSVGAYRVGSRIPVALAAVAAYAALAVALHELGSPQQLPDFVAFALVLAAVWGVGSVVRRWRAQEVQRRQEAAERATAAERARIARELHDVVTHHVTAMVVQADAAQFVIDAAPDRAAQGLTAIAGTGRRALTELRALLDVLEATGEDPAPAAAPTLRTLPDLVEHARQSGQPVELVETGAARPLPVDAELAAYRVVQEALTNAMKYAAGSRTVVRVEHAPSGVRIDVASGAASTTATSAARSPGSGGRGLPALRDRVHRLGGELAAGPADDGGFRVRARIPSAPPVEVGP